MPSKKVYRRKKRAPPRKRKDNVYNMRKFNPWGTSVRSLIPQRMVTEFTYCDKFQLDLETPGAAVRVHRFSFNGMYDPNITGVGHQPRMFDQASTLFNKYLVVSSQVFVSFGMTKSNTEAYMVGLCRNRDAAYPRTSWIDYCEPRDSIVRHLNENETNQATTLKIGYSAKKEHGVANVLDREGHLGAIFGASPTEQAYCDVWAACADDGGTNGPLLDCTITIRYRAILFDPRTPGQS